MRSLKEHKIALIVPFICLICSIAVLVPYLLYAGEYDLSWTEYEMYNIDNCDEEHTDHIVINQKSGENAVNFYGHYQYPYFEYALATVEETDAINNEYMTFSLNEEHTDWHTIVGSGFLFNVNRDSKTGYLVLYEESSVNLYYLNDFSNTSALVDKEMNGNTFNKIGICLSTAERSDSKLHNVNIQASADHLKYIDNDEVVFDVDLPNNTSGTEFGPAVQWNSHDGCEVVSHVTYSQVGCVTNISAPTANFDFSVSTAGLNQSVYVINKSFDNNDPVTTLTYYWKVERVNDDGTFTELYSGTVTPSNYNKWGTGVYRTTLQVTNEYCLTSEVVKTNEIVSNPTVFIEPVKEEYYSEDTVAFNVGGWYNCSTSSEDVVIKAEVSDNLYAPSIKLVGSSDISSATGSLTAEVEFDYSDGASSVQTASVPAGGTTVTDDANKDKMISQITVTYKSLPALAKINDGSYITFSYQTMEPLSNYYVGGGSPRRYEISNSVTCTLNLEGNLVTANSSASTKIIQKTASFSLNGTVDNRNAITEKPACNTEFLLTGFSSGGEAITQYVVVTNGSSDLTTVPYGEYILREVEEFAEGYVDIAPISITVDSKGITVNDETVVKDGDVVEFVKPLQVAAVTVTRTCKSEDGINIESDTDFKAALTGTPSAKGINVNFELVSPQDDETYYYNNKTSPIILPAGTYRIEETQSYRLVALESIKKDGYAIWDRVLNSKADMPTGSAAFICNNDETPAVTFNYVSDEYTYNERIYTNNLSFSAAQDNVSGAKVAPKDIDKVNVDPSEFKFPITLVNTETNERYCGIVDSDKEKSFGYMYPGKYLIVCSNNMYMDFEKLEALNSENAEFSNEGGQYYLTVSSEPASGTFQETETLTDWRGYSAISVSEADSTGKSVYPVIQSHVALTAMSVDQDGEPVANCEFQIFDKDGEPLYFALRDGRWYPSDSDNSAAVTIFHTNENGEFNFYEFPTGEYTITETPPSDTYYALVPEQTIIVTGKRNMGVYMIFADAEKMYSPTSIDLFLSKTTIGVGETIQIASKIINSGAYKNITHTTLDDTIINVTEDGLVTGLAEGIAVVTVISDMSGKPIGTIEITVKDFVDDPDIVSLNLNSSSVSLEVGETYEPNVLHTPANAILPALTWTSEDASIASVSDDGTITAVNKGITDIIVTSGDLNASIRVTVNQPIVLGEKIEFDVDAQGVQLIYNYPTLSKGKLSTTVLPEDTSNPELQFESSDPRVVAVDADGSLTAKSAGSVVITASLFDGTSADCLVTSVPVIDEISFNIDNCSIVKGSSAKITAVTGPKGSINEDSLVWESSDSSIVSVDQNGNITALSVGSAVVILTSSYPGTDDVVASCNVNVTTDIVQASKLDVCKDNIFVTTEFTEPIEISMGSEYVFFARVRPTSTTDPEIIWAVGEDNMISIVPADDSYDASKPINKFKIVADGDHGGLVTVTGTIKGTGVTTTFVVDVDEPGTGITLDVPDNPLPNDNVTNASAYKLILGKEPYNQVDIDIKFNNELSKAKNINWTTSDSSIANVEFTKDDKSSIHVTALKVGTTRLTAETEFRIGGTYTAYIDIVVEEPKISVYADGAVTTELFVGNTDPQLFVVEPNYPTADNIDYAFDYNESFVSIETSVDDNTDYGKAYNTLGLVTGKDVPVTITSSDSMVAPIEITITVGYPVIIYDTSGSSVVAKYNVKAGSSLTLPSLSSGGYGTTIGQSSASYINGQSITVNSDVTLYCLVPYTVNVYDGSSLKASYSVVRGKTQTLPSYSGAGYGTSSSATSASYSNGQTITVTSNLNLYCLYSVYIYDGSTLKASYIRAKNASLTLPSYSAAGYGTSSSATSSSYSNGQTITITSNLNLYCLYTVKIYDGSTLKASYIRAKNASLTLPSYAGAGYSTSSSATSVTYSNGQSITVTSSINLYCIHTLNGYVNNAVNLNAIAGATIRFRSGNNNTSGTYVTGTIQSDSSGNFSVILPPGNYTAEVAKTGFVTAYVNMVSDSSGTQQTATLSPLQNEGDIRVILKWGSDPKDLDTHLEGTYNGSAVNVYYGSKTFSDVITLDVDCTSSGGPETLSITWGNVGESYTYWVQDWTNKSNTSSTAMSNSGAYVDIYQSNKLVKTIYIPSGCVGTKWTVFKINSDGSIAVINTVGN